MSNAQKALDEYEAKPVAELVENAEQLIYAMCQDGAAKHWRMSIPVHPGDSDIILTAALNSSKKQIADLQRQNELLRAVAKWSKEYWAHQDFISEYNTGNPAGKFMDWNRIGNDDWENERQTRKALQAAIDGGAMGEG